jgi:asparagine synthase (glutamine-hydrolysing)
MSALSGIFKFDPRDRVQPEELLDLARRTDRIGPNGGSEYLHRCIGMAYRAFHTTAESRREAQPLVHRGFTLTWDGRLDNREQIHSKVGFVFDSNPTDADLVAAAVEKWGTGCFRELTGDWALAMWDPAGNRLLLARDVMGVRRLFFRLDAGGVAWCTTVEPLVQTASTPLHLDLDYLAGCLYPRPPIEATAYREIRSVVPACFVEFRLGGGHRSERFWSLNPHASIRYASDSDYEEHFRSIFRDSVRRRLRTSGPILAELSGGVDSSSIVCMADNIGREGSEAPIETLSYYDRDEPSGDERLYFTLVEQKRGRSGHHISLSDFNRDFGREAWMPLPDSCFSASPGYSARSLRWASALESIHAQCGARVLLSGTGGDEILGGVQYEAPELADYLLRGELIPFCRSIVQWSLARRKTVYELLGDAVELLVARYRPASMIADRESRLPWALVERPSHRDALQTFSSWVDLSPVKLSMELTRYALAQQLTCTDPPLLGCVEKRYPFLDRSLFVFLASIPRTQVLQAGRRRHLLRRALRGLVPDRVLDRKTKWFGMRSPAAALATGQADVNRLLLEPWQTASTVFDTAVLRKSILEVQHGATGDAIALRSAIGIEQWLRSQLRHGTLLYEPAAIDRVPVSESVHTAL